MIYDMRIYTLRTHVRDQFLGAYAEVLPHREKYSKLTAFWFSEIGPLNQVIHVWGYKDGVERMKVREAVRRDPHWPPKVREFLISQECKLLKPVPFLPEPLQGELGAVYEIRTYTFQPGAIPGVIEAWSQIIEERKKLSPLAACWYTDIGPLNQWIHVWPYADLNERERVRAQQAKLPGWPPKTRQWMVSQENRLVIPAPFSPMR